MQLGEWTVVTGRLQTGSPGSDEWSDFLCIRQTGSGYELAVCAYALDDDGEETDNFIVDPSIEPVELVGAGRHEIVAALDSLNWSPSDADRVAAVIGKMRS